MPENLRTTTLRFNLAKELHRRAWNYLQNMDKAQFKSYTQVVSVALIEFSTAIPKDRTIRILRAERRRSAL